MVGPPLQSDPADDIGRPNRRLDRAPRPGGARPAVIALRARVDTLPAVPRRPPPLYPTPAATKDIHGKKGWARPGRTNGFLTIPVEFGLEAVSDREAWLRPLDPRPPSFPPGVL